LTSNFGSGPESMPEILWGGDRALVAWTTPVTQEAPDLASVAGGLAYPW
jgi:hypothetical protein